MSSEHTGRSTSEYLHDAVLDSTHVEHFLDELCRHAAQSLGDEQILCGITLLRHKRAATVASSSEEARKMDEVQYSFNDGPCLTASREQTAIHVPDVSHERRWPDYISAITGYGMHSILAVPFDLEGEARAALNLYSSTADRFTADAMSEAAAYAGEASRSLHLAVRIAGELEAANDLKAAMASRTVIDIAVGVIMGQNRCSQDEAFEFLKKASSHRNVKLRDIAGQIVSGPGNGSQPQTHFNA